MTCREVVENRSFDNLQVCRMEGVAIPSCPFLIFEIERESAPIKQGQTLYIVRAGPRREVVDQLPTLDAAARDELGVQPDDVRIMVNVSRGYVLRIVLLEDSTQEVQ